CPGADVDDAATAGLEEVRQRSLGGYDGRLEIRREHEVPGRDIAALERLPTKATGNVDEGVDSRGARRDGCDRFARLLDACQIDTGEHHVRRREFGGERRRRGRAS